MWVQGKYTLNKNNEYRFGRCVLTRDDLIMMYLDRRNSIRKMAKDLGVGWKTMTHIMVEVGAFRDKNETLSPARMRILRYIARYQERHRQSPLLIEISEALEMSVGNVHHHLSRLQADGILMWNRKRRTIKIIRKIPEVDPKPYLGKEIAMYCRNQRR